MWPTFRLFFGSARHHRHTVIRFLPCARTHRACTAARAPATPAALIAGLAFIAEQPGRLAAIGGAAGAALVAGLAFIAELARRLIGRGDGRRGGEGRGAQTGQDHLALHTLTSSPGACPPRRSSLIARDGRGWAFSPGTTSPGSATACRRVAPAALSRGGTSTSVAGRRRAARGPSLLTPPVRVPWKRTGYGSAAEVKLARRTRRRFFLGRLSDLCGEFFTRRHEGDSGGATVVFYGYRSEVGADPRRRTPGRRPGRASWMCKANARADRQSSRGGEDGNVAWRQRSSCRSSGIVSSRGSRAAWQPASPHRRADAALCLATDLGMGFPFEHGLQTTVIAMRLADRLGVDRETASRPTTPACSRTPVARRRRTSRRRCSAAR